jgi:hypothetical protein
MLNNLLFTDNLKEALIAKLANQAEELYADALKLLQKDNVKHLWDKEWIFLVSMIFSPPFLC